jgi:two-component system response regulator RegX3
MRPTDRIGIRRVIDSTRRSWIGPPRPKEYELLVALLRKEGDVVTRSELLREVWGYEPLVSSRTVDTHILALRRKLEPDHAAPRHILTSRARGYRLARLAASSAVRSGRAARPEQVEYAGQDR